jgi:osmoprotectant transport system ATP-binding protein
MRLINRMIELSGGEILLDGESIADRDPSRLRREIGYAIQQIGLFPHRSVAQNIATVPELLGWDHARVRTRVDELMELIGLDQDMGARFPAQLSGGQRQRVGVARALAADPPLMLMDEPFGAIDPITRTRLQNEFLRLQEQVKKTIVFVTHDIDEAIKMGDRIAILRVGGVLAQYATPEEILMSPADAFVEDFVGEDRALKRLSLQRVADVELGPAPVDSDAPRVHATTLLRDALAELMSHGARDAVVVDDKDAVLGSISVARIASLLDHERAA